MKATNENIWRNTDKLTKRIIKLRHDLFHADLDTDGLPRMKSKVTFAGGLHDNYSGIYNVKTYGGAVGNGVADDTTRIQTTIDAAAGKIVYFPDGTYLISSVLTIPSNTVINLGKATVKLANNSNSHVFTNSDHTNGNTNIRIFGGKIDGNKANQTASWGNDSDYNNVTVGTACGVSFKKVTDSIIQDVVMFDTYHEGVEILGCNAIIVSNCVISSPGDDGVSIVYSNQVDVVDNIIYDLDASAGAGPSAIEIDDGSYHISVRGNIISDDATRRAAGTSTANGIAVKSHDGFPCPYDITLVGNVIYDVRSGIHVYTRVQNADDKTRNVQIVGNTIKDVNDYHGVRIEGACKDISVTANTIRNCLQGGVYVGKGILGNTGTGTENVTISGNIITACVGTHAGIYLVGSSTSKAKTIVIANNVISMNKTGVMAQYLEDLHVANNVISRNNSLGIWMQYVEFVTIAKNTIKENSQSSPTADGAIMAATACNHLRVLDNHLCDLQSSMSSSLTSDASLGQKNVVVSDASVFFVNQQVTISDDTPQSENNQIASIDISANTLTMTTNLTNTYTVTQNAVVTGRTTQQWGFENTQAADDVHIVGNRFSGNSSGAVSLHASTTNIVRERNTGYVTENSGTGTISSGSTSAIITHGLDVTPTAADIIITLTNNPTNTPGAIWVDTITSTQFTVHCENDPGVSGLNFSWKVNI